METETIDRLFLELSQVTKAKTARELGLLDEIARLRAELDKRPNLDANDCTALLCVISGDIVQPDLGWFGRIEDELSAVAKRG